MCLLCNTYKATGIQDGLGVREKEIYLKEHEQDKPTQN